MSVDEDRASDRRFFITFAVLVVVEAVLGIVADSGAISLPVWLILAVAAVLITGAVSAVVQRRDT